MTPQQPFKTKFIVSQPFKGEAHLGLDLVPVPSAPEPVYPILAGKLRYYYEEYNGHNSKAIAIDTVLDRPYINYLKGLGKIPNDYNGQITLVHIYLHGLEILDKDGWVDQGIPIMKCGNTGDVYTYENGKYTPVPESEKGVAPFRGLHLHLQCQLLGDDNKNFDWIDPQLIINYKNMKLYKDERTTPPTIVVGFEVDTPENLKWFANQTGVMLPLKSDGTLDWDNVNYSGKIS